MPGRLLNALANVMLVSVLPATSEPVSWRNIQTVGFWIIEKAVHFCIDSCSGR